MRRRVLSLSLGILGSTVAAVCAMDFSNFTYHQPSRRVYTESVHHQVMSHPVVFCEECQARIAASCNCNQSFAPAVPWPMTSHYGPTMPLQQTPGATMTPSIPRADAASNEGVQRLQAELAACKLREEKLRQRVSELEVQVEQKTARLTEAAQEMKATRQELASVRTQVEKCTENASQLRETLKTSETDNQAVIRAIIQVLQFELEQAEEESR